MIQFRDLNKQYKKLKPQINAAIQDVINSTSFILGKQVTDLEDTLAKYVNRKHCITCANGTDALVLSLKAHNVGSGDAVFVPDFTYIASASCASLVGATPVFVDIDINTYNMDYRSLQLAIEKTLNDGILNPKAIIPVDLFGLASDYDNILKIAKKYNLIVLEDAAQGFGGGILKDGAQDFGGSTGLKLNGSFGDISATSFFPAKPLGCYGDGGAIFCDDDATCNRLRSLRAGGRSLKDKYDNIEIGQNSRLDTLQAAILLAKFDNFVNFEIDAVNRSAKMYTDRLKDYVAVPFVPDGYVSSWAQYTIRLKNKRQRDKLQQCLKATDIPSMVYYPKPMHKQTAFKDLKYFDDNFTNSLLATETVLSLPMHPYLDEASIDFICEQIIKNIK